MNKTGAKLDGTALREMIIAGASALQAKRDHIDALNVFPVPDGDTGTNMSLTALSAAKELPETADVYAVAKAAAAGSLRGARGNSGVILSQLFRGFAKGLEGRKTANGADIANAFVKAAETAYKAVMKPKEGTMLTVAREMGERATAASKETDDPAAVAKAAIERGEAVLKKTIDMLPALKQAGVIDAGGEGLMTLLRGAIARDGSPLPEIFQEKPAAPLQTLGALGIAAADIHFAYCTEFFVTPKENPEAAQADLAAYLETIGDSLVVVGDEEIIKIHVHTNNPGLALEKALSFGELNNLKIENMRLQHTSIMEAAGSLESKAEPKQEPKKPLAVVSVSAGAGFKALFEGLSGENVPVCVIEGGQTMNPSAEDIAGACRAANAERVVILPNNKNIVLAAQQAGYLLDGVETAVVPTKSVPQGIAALLTLNGDEADAKETAARMERAITDVKTGQVTLAVRDTEVDGVSIHEGDALCMLDGAIVATAHSCEDAALTVLNRAVDDASEIITIYYGDGADAATAEELAETARAAYPACDVELQEGGQPVYPYILSVE